ITSLIGIRLIPDGQGFVVSQKEETLNNVRVLKVTLAPPHGAEGQTDAAGAGKDSDETVSEGNDTAQGDSSQNENQSEDTAHTGEAANANADADASANAGDNAAGE